MWFKAAFVAAVVQGLASSGYSTSSELVEPTSCVWPECYRGKCDPSPCNREVPVGTCALSTAQIVSSGCHKDRGPTKCFLGQCLCAPDYCPSPDEESCVRRECLPGPEVPLYQPTEWVEKFVALGQGISFLPPNATQDECMEFVKVVAKWPCVLVSTGLVVGLITFLCLCGSIGVKNRDQLRARGKRTLRNSSWNDQYARLPKEETEDEPSVFPMLCMASVLLALNVVAIVVRQSSWVRTNRVTDDLLTRMRSNVRQVADNTKLITDTVRTLRRTAIEAPKTCRFLPSNIKEQLSTVANASIAMYCDMVEDLYRQVEPLPEQVEQADMYLRLAKPWIQWGPLLPMIVMATMSGFMVLEAVLTKFLGTSTLARREDCGLRVASGLFFSVILVVSMVAAAEMGAGIAVSLFCSDLESNVVSYMEYGLVIKNISENTSAMISNLSNFYIFGDPPNPLLPQFLTAEQYGKLAWRYYKSELVLLNKEAPAIICPGLENLSIPRMFYVMNKSLRESYDLILAKNIYPYYHGVAHKAMCGSLLDTLGYLMVLQVIAGLILFPASAVLTHRFLGSWSAWKFSADEAREEFLYDMAEATGKFPGDHGELTSWSSDSEDEREPCLCWPRGSNAGTRSGHDMRESRSAVGDSDWSPRH